MHSALRPVLFAGRPSSLVWSLFLNYDQEVESDVEISLTRPPESLLSKEIFLQVLDALPDFVIIKDSAAEVLWTNKACQMLDLTKLLPVSHENPVYLNGRPLQALRQTVRAATGELRHLRTTKSQIRSADGRNYFTLEISQDITRDLEREKLIEEQSEKMTTSNRMSALGEMAGGVAHEINSPLAIISSLAQQMIETLNEKDAVPLNQLKKSLATIDRTVHRIAMIVKSLRSISRDGSRDPFVPTPVKAILDETFALCSERFRLSEIRLKKPTVPTDLRFSCRATEISQALLNLLNNSFDAVSETSDPWIEVTVEDKPNYIEIAVTDNGKGIPSDIQNKIFNPFFTTKEIGKGTGLGLGIVYRIMNNHRGKIELDLSSALTRFVLQFPKIP